MTLPDATRVERYRVVRRSGLLVPGFTKLITRGPNAPSGVTLFLGIRIGAFDVRPASEFGYVDDVPRCLRYRRWPVVDVLEQRPSTMGLGVAAAGYVRLPGRRRIRFCRFVLVPSPTDMSVANGSPD